MTLGIKTCNFRVPSSELKATFLYQLHSSLPISSKQHMIIRHQQQIVRFTHKTFRKIWAKNKLKVRILVFRGAAVVHIILFQTHFKT